MDGKFATANLFCDIKYISINVAAQIYPHKYGLSESYLMTQVNGEQVGLSFT